MIKNIFKILLIALGLAFTFGSKDSFSSDLIKSPKKIKQPITLAYVNWDSEIASTYVIAEVLRQEGYDVTMTPVELAPMFEAVATGQADATVSAWLPNTHEILYGNVADDLVDLGPHLEGNKPGLVVPTYMEVDSIDELTDEAGQVITGQEPGAGQTKMVYQALEDYPNLSDWEQLPSSAGAMFSVLADAYPKQEEIIISGWSPHWSFIEYDLKFLEDPLGTFGDGEFIHTLVRQDLETDMPEAYRILDNFYWEVKDLEAVMFEIYNGESPQTAAQNWIEANPEKVSSWIVE